MDEDLRKYKKTSRWWYLLPILFGPLGGIIGYFILKDRDRKFAEKLLIIGVAIILVYIALSFLLSLIGYVYINQIFEKTTNTIEAVDIFCSAGTTTVFLRNHGSETISASELSCVQTAGQCSGVCSPPELAPNTATSFTISGCSLGILHTWSISGPSNSITVSTSC
jgi:hypothetical protein